jgi:UDP-N-acetylmuramyl pentapeptide phosphotransferase/UDP-N-acetylglucosamine-1-phosphate transferase
LAFIKDSLKGKPKLFFSVVLPLIWGAIAASSLRFGGGENLAMAMALLPGILAGKVFGTGFSGSGLVVMIVLGMVLMAAFGWWCDWMELKARDALIAGCLGVSLAIAVVGIFFLIEAKNSGSLSRAFQRFDFDQPARVIGWWVFCSSLGLYIGMFISLILRAFKPEGNDARPDVPTL